MQGFASRRPGLQIVRGLGMLGSAVFFMSGIVFLPVADATAIFFILPILLTAFAVVFLHEVVGWRRWAAAVIGFLRGTDRDAPGHRRLPDRIALPRAGGNLLGHRGDDHALCQRARRTGDDARLVGPGGFRHRQLRRTVLLGRATGQTSSG